MSGQSPSPALRPMRREHFCWSKFDSLNESTTPTMWLAPRNEQLHRCQRCGYFVWRAS